MGKDASSCAFGDQATSVYDEQHWKRGFKPMNYTGNLPQRDPFTKTCEAEKRRDKAVMRVSRTSKQHAKRGLLTKCKGAPSRLKYNTQGNLCLQHPSFRLRAQRTLFIRSTGM
eukprot:1158812-Pelagomonas_calceolata.AAC.5